MTEKTAPASKGFPRRHFLKLCLGTAGVFTLGSAYTLGVEPTLVEVTRQSLKIVGLPKAFNGMRLAHITDLHRSHLVSLDYLYDCVAKVNSLHADLLLVTGDYITGRQNVSGLKRKLYGKGVEVEEFMSECAGAIGRAKTRYGTFASLGNHDHWFNGDYVTRSLTEEGVTVLRNKNTLIEESGQTLEIVGLGDLWTEKLDFQKAFSGTQGAFQIVLMHNPDTFEKWDRPGSHMILSGHTHGGQVNIPFFGAPIVPSKYGNKYAQGLFQKGNTRMYVNRGLGSIAPPVRFNCRPEIALIELGCA
ncbi:MAG: metallophosphoesterase [Verrucomicrobiota bacterium]|nr:metallophosphoesterase [Verrucomicrobiota bacterium]